jgi:hypothetical protein
MQRKSRSIALVLLLIFSVLSWTGPLLRAQAPIPTPQELDQLLAPVALYPDSLLAQITTASTNPQEILDVSNWLQQNPGLQGAALTDAAEKQGFDAAFVALVMFPDVINMMAEDVDDFAAIGEAFTADQGAVSASIQRLRAQAYAAGTLQSNQQQTVQVEQVAAQPVYVIQPANPQVVYVPIYNPTTVYYRSPTPVYVTYGPPIPISILVVSTRPWGWMGWGWNWSSHRAYYNHTVWVGWRAPYRPPNYWYRPRPIPYNARPGYGGNWNYRPPNYRPPTPRPLPSNRPAWGPNNRPGNQPPGNRPGNGRPPVQQPKPGGKPGQPTTRPGNPNQPGGTRPGGNPPGQTKPTQPNGNRPPVTKPAQPSTRPTQPTTRPAPQPSTRPTQPTTKPAPQPSTRPTQPTTRPAPQPSTRPTQPATRPAPQPSTRPTQPATRPAQPNTKQTKPNAKPPQGQNSGSRPPPQSKNPNWLKTL